MPTVAVEAELYDRIEKAAKKHKANIDELLNQAIRRYLWELDRRKISDESKIYRQQYTELKAKYQGQYIAMHEGQVVDHDPDFEALYQRIRQQFKNTPVMITMVEETAEKNFVRRGFRLESNKFVKYHTNYQPSIVPFRY